MKREEELAYVSKWACCSEPERRVVAEHEVKHLLSLIIREWPGGGWTATLPVSGLKLHGGKELPDAPGKYYFRDRDVAVQAVQSFKETELTRT